MSTFADFGLLPSLLKTLKEKRISKPTEIQQHAIPMMLSRQSVVGIAETGSGKTLAYALPILHMLKSMENNDNPVTEENTPRAIIMVPTRELGEQVSKVLKTLTHDTRLRVRPALGGMAFEHARRNVSGSFEILLATPGRLLQLMDRKLVHLTDVRVLVFDEADQMLDKGFLPDSQAIVAECPSILQMGLFSATASPAVEELIQSLFAGAQTYRSAGSGKVVKTLTTKNMIVQDGKRWPVFEKVLNQRTEGGTLVFTNTREQCDRLAQELKGKGFLCAIYRGDMDKGERRRNFKDFREGKIDMLVATDVAARGLDVENVGRVINFHLPQDMQNYLHRAGRTARAGRPGLVVNLVTERDERLIAQLEGRKPAHGPNGPRHKKPRKAPAGAKPVARAAKKIEAKPPRKETPKSHVERKAEKAAASKFERRGPKKPGRR